MNDDKMRAEFEKWAKAVGHDLSQTKGDDRYWFVSTESAWESWQAAYQAGQKAEQAEVERLRGDVDFHSEAFQGLIDYLAEKKAENDKLRAELAAAKAASVVPVEVEVVDISMDGVWKHGCLVDVLVKGRKEEGLEFVKWLRERMKDAPPPAT